MGCLQKLTRKKYIDLGQVSNSSLSRCLTALDLTALGIGSTLGTGIYVLVGVVGRSTAGPAVLLSFSIAAVAAVLAGIGCTLGAGIYVVAGQVARQVTGPAVIIAFFIAAVASMLAGICYAEFGARVPKAGSAYIYSFVTLGELWAFVIGWNLILEYVIGTASVARALSSYFDSLINGTVSKYLLEHTPMNVPTLSPYPDFIAFGITIVLCGVLSFGVKESSIVNNIFTVLNLLVVSFIFICGLFKVNIDNWQIPASQVPNATTDGEGGFFPFGATGVFSGAATCFYAFVGFDVIATTGEEVKNPQRAIPLGIILSLLACFVAYSGVSAVITLMVPYYSIDMDAPLPAAFDAVGWGVARYIIAVGAVCGLSASLLGGMFPMPRIVYAMASDGLLFKFLAHVSQRFKTPVIASLVTGTLAGLMAMLFDLKELVDMMSIGTLLAYTLVAMCVLILRYELPDTGNASTNTFIRELPAKRADVLLMLLKPRAIAPDYHSVLIVKAAVFVLVIFIVLLGGVEIFWSEQVAAGEWWAVLLLSLAVIGTLTTVAIISRQPESHVTLAFKVPLVPWIPALSMLINIYLMMKLPAITWLRFAVWMAVGFLIYFGYSIWHSVEGRDKPGYESLDGESYQGEEEPKSIIHNEIGNSKAQTYGTTETSKTG